MERSKIKQIKGALLKCAEENRDKVTFTFYQNVSRLCEDAELRIRELEKAFNVVKEKLVAQNYDYATRINDALDYIDEQLGE